MSTADKLNLLEEKSAKILECGGPKAVEKQHALGKKTARERIDLLLDPGTFKEIDRFVTHRCANFGMAGKEIPADWTGTIETGSVVLTDMGKNVAAGTKEKLDSVIAGLKDGTIKVFDTANFTVKGEKLTSYKADVDTDAAFEKDTEVIENGIFMESKFRSGPYFDLEIDGITLLDRNYGE